MNRQKLLLSIFLVLLALSLAYSYWKIPRQKTVDRLTYTPGSTAKAKKSPSQPLPPDMRVRLDLLDRQPMSFTGFKRNIFGLSGQEKKSVAAKHVRRTARTVVPLPPPPPAPQISPVQRDMAQLTFLGFLKKDNKKTIFLTGNNEIFLAKKGDTIMGRYQVTDISDEALTIRSSLDGTETVIPLIENRPLNVSGQ
jgi:hypothetical protein